MIEQLINIDQELFLILNGLHTAWVDPIMIGLSLKWIWAPLYVLLIWKLYQNYGWQAIGYVIAVLLAIGLTDQLTSGFMKPFFERLRPCHDPVIASLTHIVDGCGGKYGFVSGHSANSFCIAVFFVTVFSNKSGYGWLIVWAAAVAFSRIYLGVHYPGDIIIGGIIGSIIGMFAAKSVTHFVTAKN